MGMKIDQTTKEEEASRLQTLIDASNISSQAEFARRCEAPGGKSMLSQHLKCIRPISLESAIAYAIGLNKPLSAISPRLDALVRRIPKADPPYPATQQQPAPCATEPANVALFPTNSFSPTVMEIAKIAETMSRDGQMMLLGHAQLLAGQHPRDKANTAK